MSSASNYLENALLDHALGTTAYTHPAQLYVALFTSAASDSGPGTEVTGGGYARIACNFNASSGGVATKSSTLSWTASGAGYGTVTHIGLFDTSSGGNMLWWAILTSSRVINDGDTLEITSLQVTLT